MSQINVSAIKTPGVYVNEIPSFPPSIAQVATAIPVFIGYTQKAVDGNGNNVTMKPVRISSINEYNMYFGAGYPNLTAEIFMSKDTNNNYSVGSVSITPAFQMYNSVQMFFNNGGGVCYILSVGPYSTNTDVKSGNTIPPDIENAQLSDFFPSSGSCFDIIQKEDEPTLIVIPDAILFNGKNETTTDDFNTLMQTSLNLCGNLQDRFTIMDIVNGDQPRSYNDDTDIISSFRAGIGGSNLTYGAAYYPWLNTSLNSLLQLKFTYSNIQLIDTDGSYKKLIDFIPISDSSLPFIKQIEAAILDQNNIITPDLLSNPDYNPLISNVHTLLDFVNLIKQIVENINVFTNLNKSTPNLITDTSPASQGGLCVLSIYNNLILPSTILPLSPPVPPLYKPLENIMGQLSQIISQYPGTSSTELTVLQSSVNSNTLFSQSYDGTYNIPTPANIYGSNPPITDKGAIAYILPTLTNIFRNVVSMINNFTNDVNNLITGLENQIIANSLLYSNIKAAILRNGILVPPSGAIAGVYAAVDSTRGVWKAPANVSLNLIIQPAVKIDDEIQEDLNIDTNAGKSVNAIRAFTGKGTYVWGARTLAGNDNDFRYISVRRFYIMVEESVKLAAFQFVFEPNDGSTWIRIRAMIENYLTNLWRLGALAGSKPEQAFYVKIGLGQTMTFDDILNGRMIVEIGMAPVRPAEFIILRFSQIQQQA